MDFFDFQDLIKPGSGYQDIDYFLKPNGFKRSGTLATTYQYIEYREKVLAFIEKRSERMDSCVMKNHPDIEVRQQRLGSPK